MRSRLHFQLRILDKLTQAIVLTASQDGRCSTEA